MLIETFLGTVSHEIKIKQKDTMNKKKVLGVGTALVDVIEQVSDETITNLNLHKGTMALIDNNDVGRIKKEIHSPTITSGGSVCNTVYELQRSGSPSAFFGKITNDDYGNAFFESMQEIGLEFRGSKNDYDQGTGCCHIFVTPDGERTMATHIGIGSQLQPSDINENILDDIKHVYLETYLWDHDLTKKTLMEISKRAKELSIEVSMSLSDPFCVQRHREELLEFIKQNVDLVFCNFDEASEISESKDLEEIKNFMSALGCKTVLTNGAEGAHFISKEYTDFVSAEKVQNVIDTTGAGDNFAAGFLSKYIQGENIRVSLESGHEKASQVIQKIGPRL